MIPRMRLTSEQNGAGEQGRQSGSLVAWIVFVVGAAIFLSCAVSPKISGQALTVNPRNIQSHYQWNEKILGSEIALPQVDMFGQKIEIEAGYLHVSIPADCCGSKWFFDVLQEVKDVTVVILAAEPSTEFQQKVKSIPNLRLIANIDLSPYASEFAQRPPQIARIVKGVAVEVPKHSQSFSDFIEGKKAGQQ